MNTVNGPFRHWWTNPRRVLRFGPLYCALMAAELLARLSPGRWRRPSDFAWTPGLSVLIPERGTPELLAETLAALHDALQKITEPAQVVVVVNGAEISAYATLKQRFPQSQWLHYPKALGYTGAIAAGLKQARYDWVYLLNSDMRLDANALIELLPYRQAHVFAVASQIFFVDPTRRREETGWADFVRNPSMAEIYDRTPENSESARGSLYPGGGSSLCRTQRLRRYVRDSACYAPFYWEDAEWGVRAWGDGYEVVFCPRSHAHHHHRSTINRCYEAEEVKRIWRRNGLLFDLRHGWTVLRPGAFIHQIAACDSATQRELTRLGIAFGAFARRLATSRARRRGLDFAALTSKYYPQPYTRAKQRPRVLLVAPFALFPPAHGGARRVCELVQRLAAKVDFVLLGDERSLYNAASEPWFRHFVAVHLVEGRADIIGEPPLALWPRIQRHAHPKLRAELERLIAVYDPDIVQIEFIELAALASRRLGRARWLLALHDVYLIRHPDTAASDAAQDRLLAHFDALTVCSREDAELLRHPHVELIENGATSPLDRYIPSPNAERLLFMGPLRYPPNHAGIRAFLAAVWPKLYAQFPQITLTILGGTEAACATAGDALFAQPGVEMIARFIDPAPDLERAALTINPQLDIRGSSLKLIESLLAGRVCVSTRDGARGFLDTPLAGLVLCESVTAMAQPIAALLCDSPRRRALEQPDPVMCARYDWDGIAARQASLYAKLMTL